MLAKVEFREIMKPVVWLCGYRQINDTGVVNLKIDFQPGQSGHSVANGWPLLRCFFRSCFAPPPALSREEKPPLLDTSFGVMQQHWSVFRRGIVPWPPHLTVPFNKKEQN